jgi:hypothetical protein
MNTATGGDSLIQQNSFNLMSDNSEIQIIWHFRRVVPRPKSFNFYQEKASSMEETDLMDNR